MSIAFLMLPANNPFPARLPELRKGPGGQIGPTNYKLPKKIFKPSFSFAFSESMSKYRNWSPSCLEK